MISKFFYLYLAGGILAIGLLAYNVISAYPKMASTQDIALEVLSAALLFYLAFKTWREKVDKDLM